MSSAIILGVDPGLANFGYALVRVDSSLELLGMGAIATSKSPKKTHVHAAEDNIRRVRELVDGLITALAPHVPDLRLICGESMSHPMFVNKATGQRNVMASVATQIGFSWGVVACLAEMWQVPILQARPQEVKLRVTGNQSASKEDIQAAMDKYYGCSLGERLLLPQKVCKGRWEHPYDALATILALQNSDVFRAVRGASQ